MEALETIITRQSVAPAFLAEPAPEGERLERILAAGASAPDHGRLRPWRFLVIRGEARHRLGEVFANALLWKNLLLRTCSTLLWEGERGGKRVAVWGGKK